MGLTIVEQAVQKSVARKMKDPLWCAALHDVTAKLNAGFWEIDYIDVILQKFARFSVFDIYDAECFLDIHAAICMGNVIRCRIYVGSGPGSDIEEQLNNKRLNDLPKPFQATFRGGPGDNDGWLAWNEAIMLTKHICNAIPKDCDIEICEDIKIPTGGAPLEVGYTKASTSWLHLALQRCLARWPYEHKYITLLYVIDDRLWTPFYDLPRGS